LEHLAVIARGLGIREFEAEVLGENNQMLDVFASSGFTVRRSLAGGTFHVSFPTEETPAAAAAHDRRDREAAARSIAALLAPPPPDPPPPGRPARRPRSVRPAARAPPAGPSWRTSPDAVSAGRSFP